MPPANSVSRRCLRRANGLAWTGRADSLGSAVRLDVRFNDDGDDVEVAVIGIKAPRAEAAGVVGQCLGES